MQYDKSLVIDIFSQIIDANVIQEICKEHIEELLITLKNIRNDLGNS